MRDLTAKQKTLLIKWYKEKEPTKEEEILFNKINPIKSSDDLTIEQWDILTQINDTEVLYQNVNNFLWDLKQNE